MRFLLLLIAPAASLAALAVSSPDGKIRFQLDAVDGRVTYSIRLRGKPVIEPSPLGITLDGVNLGDSARLSKGPSRRIDESYPWTGVHATARHRCNTVRVNVKHATPHAIEVRACNDGVAFRHTVPAGANARIPDESTAFRIPAGSVVWLHGFEGHYEDVHTRKAVEEVKAGEWAAPPLTVRLPNGSGYASITEGALYRYAGMGLASDGKGAFLARLGHAHPVSYPFRLRYKNDIERLSKPAAITGSITTPWRIVIVAEDLNALVNADIVHGVAPPPDKKWFADTSWIRPGRAVWKYLDGGGENSVETVKQFSRMASELGFEYQVVEGFWTRWPDAALRDVVDYSKRLGVGLILWKHSNALRTPESQRAFFRQISEAGAAGAKIDFFDHEAKDVVELYEQLLAGAAEFRLVLNFHGANKPAGESRTYPNELTREAIRGMESRKNPRARHHATLPFTRMLAGHADYTPVVFGERRNDTTWANQIATAIAFTSPMLVYGSQPKSLLDNPAVEIIKSIPSVWDETRVLPPSDIGEIAVLARRKGDTWFVAAMNGTEARTVSIPLSFLGGGEWQSLQARDVPSRGDAIEIREDTVKSSGALTLAMQPGGGLVVRLRRKS